MRIRMRTTIANARFTAIGGSIIDVPDAEAKTYLQAGYAELVKDTKPVAKPAAGNKAKPAVGNADNQ